MQEKFSLDAYLEENKAYQKSHSEQQRGAVTDHKREDTFDQLADRIYMEVKRLEKEETAASETILQRQYDAIIGVPAAVTYYRAKIREILEREHQNACEYPPWYTSLEDGIFQEAMGFCGLQEWLSPKTQALHNSSSAKVIGERIYFLINGKEVLQPQKLSQKQYHRIRAALLLTDPKKRKSDPYHEVYLLDGTRVTIFNDGLAKNGQATIVFRKFFVSRFTFEQQAELGTLPAEAIPLFRAMVDAGYNVAFLGPVRTAKTTFLATWQSYENPTLEGVLIETDPEIPLHEIMPEAPIMQLVPDDDSFDTVIRNVMRSDADYIIVAEARDGKALNVAVRAANKGTRRVKMTYHTTDIVDFAYDVSDEILKCFPGDMASTLVKVAKSFHYLFQFVQLADKSKKRLRAIWEMRYNYTTRQVTMHRICNYHYHTDTWTWACDFGADKRQLAMEENPEAVEKIEQALALLSDRYPEKEEHVFIPAFNQLLGGGVIE